MATVPVPTGRTVTPTGIAVREGGADLSVGAFGAQEAAAAAVGGDNLMKLADSELKLREDKALLDMQAGVVQLDSDYDQRFEQLKQQDLGGRGLTEVAMEDYKKVADQFVASQPTFTQNAARQSLLSSQARIAKLAVAEETRRFNEDVVNKSNDIISNMRNKVQFGQIDEATAQAQIDAFSKTLPVNFREEITRNAQQNMREAVLSRDVDKNPAATMKAIQQGKYNDVDPAFLNQQYRSAQAEVIKQQNEAIRLQKEAQTLRLTDPAAAAQSQLQAKGITNPTYAQLQQAQAELGIPAARRAAITKANATAMADQLSNVQSVDDFFTLRDQLVRSAGQAGIPQNQVIKDLIELSNMSPALAVVVDADRSVDDPRYVAAALALVRDPKAGQKALENLRTRAPDAANDSIKKLDDKVADFLEPELNVMFRSGASVDDVNQYANTVKSIASVVFVDDILGKSHNARTSANNVEQILKKGNLSRTTLVDGNDAIVLPSPTANTLDADVMADLRTGLLDRVTQPQNPYGLRPDGTPKGRGYLGEIKANDGSVMTEFSVGVQIDGKEMDVPTLIPGLTDAELKSIKAQKPTQSVIEKAAQHARQRINEGKSVWADQGASLFVPNTFPTQELGIRDIKDNAGWSMAGNSSITLRSTTTSQPLLFKNAKNELAPLVLSYDDLQDLALAPADQRVDMVLKKFAVDSERTK